MLRLEWAPRRPPARPRILDGHLWAFRGEVRIPAGVAPGRLADLYDGRRFVGRGYVNPRSEIAFRLLARRREAIDAAFFRRRIAAALDLRRRAGLEDEPARLVFSEGDLLPGFLLDRYGGVLVAAFETAGAEALRTPFLEAVAGLLPGLPIHERSDGRGRTLEGLAPRSGPVSGDPPPVVECRFDGIAVRVDIARGQKTGAFLDAREMRRHLRARAAGMRVLDAFAHIGLFGRYAAAGGAREVVFVETDAAAAAAIREALPGAEVLEENAFEVLRRLERAREAFDAVVLDPPAFTRGPSTVEAAARGYKEINLRALRLLRPGGLLYTSSCSYHLSRERFVEILRAAAADARRDVRLVARFGAAPDHPVLLGVPETDYFKGVVLEVV